MGCGGRDIADEEVDCRDRGCAGVDGVGAGSGDGGGARIRFVALQDDGDSGDAGGGEERLRGAGSFKCHIEPRS